jgi:hypothetical protein
MADCWACAAVPPKPASSIAAAKADKSILVFISILPMNLE